MIAKKQDSKFYIFNKTTGMTAVFSDDELELLKRYCISGVKTDFIKRLCDLGIITSCDYPTRASLLDSIHKGNSDSPQSLHIDITTSCPLKCPQCYKQPAKEFSMTLEAFESIISQAVQLNIFQIAVGGGEPLIHKDLLQLIRLVAKTEMSLSITTSGYGMTGETLDAMIGAGLNHIQISLNGADEEINRKSRDGYIHARNALRLLSKTKLSFGINYVARKDNIAGFESLVELAKSNHAENINVLRYKPSFAEPYENFSLSNNEFVVLADKIKKVQGIKIKVDSAYSNLLLFMNNRRVSENFCGCAAGKTFMSISANGEYKPCSHLSLSEKCTSIQDYWVKSADLERLRNFTKDYISKETTGCYSCLNFKICGGCRAICERVFNDIREEEADCPAYIRRQRDV